MTPLHNDDSVSTARNAARSLNNGQRNALRDALSMLRIEWVRNHLMGVAPLTDAAILSSPLQQMHALTFETDISLNHCNPEERNYNAMVSRESVGIPAYSRDGIYAGYKLVESYGLCSQDLLFCINGVFASRFVSREEDGKYIAFVKHSRVDLLIIVTTMSRSVILHNFAFPSGALGILLASKINDISLFERTICAVIFSENSKQCLECGARSNQPCDCSYIMRCPPAKGSLDLETIKSNMIRVHFGSSGGKGSYELFENGLSKRLIPFDTRHSNTQVSRRGPTKRLLNWAIADVLKNLPVEITRAISTSGSFRTNPLLDYSQDEGDNAVQIPAEEMHPTVLSSSVPRTTNLSSPENVGNSDLPLRPNHLPVTSQVLVGSVNTVDFYRTPKVTSLIPTPSSSVVIPNPIVKQRIEPRTKLIAPRNDTVPVPSPTHMDKFYEERMLKTQEELRAWKAYQRKLKNRESAARSNKARRERLKLARRRKRQESEKVST